MRVGDTVTIKGAVVEIGGGNVELLLPSGSKVRVKADDISAPPTKAPFKSAAIDRRRQSKG